MNILYKNKIFTVFLCIIILCINCLATSINDIDATSFLTKAEFDSLKNTYQSQLEVYSANMDSKIDTAIASYLAGLDISVFKIYDVINHDWGEVSFINGYYNNDYIIPDIYYLLAAGGYFQSDITAGGVRDWSSHAFFYYKRGANTANRKNCFYVLEGTEGNPIKMQWRGIARGYRESIVYAMERNAKYSALSGWNWPNYNKRVMIKNPMKPTGASYSINSDSVITDITLECQSKINTSSTWEVQPKNSDVFTKAITNLSITTDKVADKEFDTEHIVGWRRDTTWEMYCTDWNHTWQLSPNQTVNETNIYDATTKSTSGWYQGLERNTSESEGVKSDQGSMPFAFSNGTSNFYSVGLYNAAVSNSQLYQMSDDLYYKSSKAFTVPNVTLEKGLPILAASKGDEVTYTPVISRVECYDESGNYVINANEVDIYFSYVPFTDESTTTEPVKLTKEGTTSTYTTTTDRKATVKFRMDKDSVVYMKLKPHFIEGATYGPNHFWVVDFDLTGDANTYKIKPENK